MISWVDDNAQMTLKELQAKVLDVFDIKVSISTIDRVLRGFHYSLKSIVTVPERRNCDVTIQKRLEYAERFRELESSTPHQDIIFLDEVGFSVVTRPKRGRSAIGQSTYVSVPAVRSRNISVAAAMNKNGMVYKKVFDRAVNGETFKAFLLDLKIKCLEKGITDPVFVLDNARIHHYTGLNDVIRDNGIRMFYLPPYSPFLNPIENIFSVWKNIVIRQRCCNETQLKSATDSGFDQIPTENCDAFYRKILRYVTASSRGEVILE